MTATLPTAGLSFCRTCLAEGCTAHADKSGGYWAKTVDPRAHALAHPVSQQDCPACPQVATCVWCGLPQDRCPDWGRHADLDRQSDYHQPATQMGTAWYGRDRAGAVS